MQTALTYLENLKDDAASDETLSAELAAAYEKIGNVQGNPLSPNLGDMQGAVVRFRRAEDLLAPLAAKSSGDARLRLASVVHARGLVHRGLGDVKGATSAYARSREIGERLLAVRPDDRACLALMGALYGDISQMSRDLRDYGNLGDVLGARVGSNLGDTKGAEEAFARASELAEWIYSRDHADRRAMFDLASGKLRRGTLLIGDESSVAVGLQQLEDAADLNRRLLAEEPDSKRYGFFGLVLDQRIGDALTKVGRRVEAVRTFEGIRAAGPKLSKGPNGPAVRLQMALAAVRLAALHAEARDPRASALVTVAWNEMTSKPPDMPLVDAEAFATLDRAYLALAASDRTGQGDALRASATASVTKSVELWRQVKLPAPLEPRRAKELERLAGNPGGELRPLIS